MQYWPKKNTWSTAFTDFAGAWSLRHHLPRQPFPSTDFSSPLCNFHCTFYWPAAAWALTQLVLVRRWPILNESRHDNPPLFSTMLFILSFFFPLFSIVFYLFSVRVHTAYAQEAFHPLHVRKMTFHSLLFLFGGGKCFFPPSLSSVNTSVEVWRCLCPKPVQILRTCLREGCFVHCPGIAALTRCRPFRARTHSPERTAKA